MRPTKILTFTSLVAALALAGCANGSGPNLLTTSSVSKPKPKKVVANPACTALAAQIKSVRLEGTPARVHAVATGKTRTVSIKRASLAKVAELDRLNAEFQMKCSMYPGTQTAAAAPIAAPAKPIAAPATPIAKRSTPAPSKPIVAVPRQ
ncbi:MAG: hypothetical protein ACR2PI_17285 [Hyphomicrobiaceae bacterium]